MNVKPDSLMLHFPNLQTRLCCKQAVSTSNMLSVYLCTYSVLRPPNSIATLDNVEILKIKGKQSMLNKKFAASQKEWD